MICGLCGFCKMIFTVFSNNGGKEKMMAPRSVFSQAAVTIAIFVTLVPVSSASDVPGSPNPFLKWKLSNMPNERGVGDVKSPLHVAQCRATCLAKFNNREAGGKTSTCFQPSDCFTCWKSCELLETSLSPSSMGWDGNIMGGGGRRKVVPTNPMRTRPICSQPRICLSGCQAACSFYETLSRQSSEVSNPVVPTNNENVLRFPDGKIQWPRNPKEAGTGGPIDSAALVYLVVQEYSDHKWRQIAQTPLTEVDIPPGLNAQQSNKLRSTRVLVVSPLGLVTIYSPQLLPKDVGNENPSRVPVILATTPSAAIDATTTTPSLTTAATTLGFELLPKDDIQPEDEDDDSSSNYEWNLRKVSLIHQKFLVIAELTWDAVPGAKDYLITWELDGGGLKGHLVTDSTVVTLSLWPDTVYHIQVELCGEEHSTADAGLVQKSFPLAVDTSEALFPMVQPSALSKTQSSHKSVTEFLNVTLLVTVSSFLFILLCLALGAFTWCRISRRRSRELRLLQDVDDDHDSTDTPKILSLSPSPSIPKEMKEGPLTVAVISNQLIYSSNNEHGSSSMDSFLRIPPPMWSSLISTGQHHHPHQPSRPNS